jgi:hypothetical protein
MADIQPILALVLIPVMMLLLWPLALASGRAKANRMRALQDDLQNGRPRGFAILASVIGMIVLFSIVGR